MLINKEKELVIKQDYPDSSIVENGQNTEKSPGDQRILAVTQTPEKEC